MYCEVVYTSYLYRFISFLVYIVCFYDYFDPPLIFSFSFFPPLFCPHLRLHGFMLQPLDSADEGTPSLSTYTNIFLYAPPFPLRFIVHAFLFVLFFHLFFYIMFESDSE
jgi:hypothetical protein